MKRYIGSLVTGLILFVAPMCQPSYTARAASPPLQLFILPQSHVSPVLHLLRDAQRSIQLEMYLLTTKSIIAELRTAVHRGVKVQVLLEQHPFGGARWAISAFDQLKAAGIQVRWANEQAFTYTHEKVVIIDGRQSGICTCNWTSSGLYKNREFGIIDHNPRDARALSSIFDADWARIPPASRPLGSLVVSPLNARSVITRLVDGAHNTLDMYAEEVADRSVELHLETAVRRHVRVRLITSQSSPSVDALRQHDVRVGILSTPYVHAKAIVADGSRVFVGSENMSTTSLDRNREVGIRVNDRDMAQRVESVFSHDWGATAMQTPTALPLPSRGTFAVRVSASPTRLRRGDELTITVHTRVGARCFVRVTYPDGYVSRARVLQDERVADGAGAAGWTWRVGSRQTGRSHVLVTCTLNGAEATGGTLFTISS